MSLPVYISRLPVFYDMKYVQEDGRMTSDSYLFNEQSFKTLSLVVNQFIEGIRVPNLPETSANPGDPSIDRYVSDPNVPFGTIWYDTDNNKLYVKTGVGTKEQIQSIP